MTPRFLIISTGYNCARNVTTNYLSVRKQRTGHDIELVMIDDASYDGTWQRILTCTDAIHVRNAHNLGAARSRYEAIKKYGKPDDIVLLLGMDDELLPDCLNTIAAQYAAGKWMTYGNWLNQNWRGLPEGFQLEFDQATHDARSYRKVAYRSTAPNTFYKFLFDAIPEDDFKLDGEWIKTTTESELMLSCLEMCGQSRIGVIHKPIYIYNMNLPNNSQQRFGQHFKNQVYARIAARNKKPLYESIEHLP